jgi:universal stress protein A
MYQKIMVAIDLSESSEAILTKVATLVAQNTAHYQVVCCYEPMLGLMTEMSLPVVGFDDSVILAAMDERLQELVSAAGLQQDCTQVIENIVGPGLCQHAELMGADLIVMGSHSRSGLRVLLGSVTNYVLHHAHCDVLALKIPV